MRFMAGNTKISNRFLLALIAACCIGTGPDPAETDERPELTDVRNLPAMPTVQLAPIDGVGDETAYTRAIADRAAELKRRAQASGEPYERAKLLLAAANLILSHQLEPACTRRILGVDHPDGLTPDQLTAALDRCDQLLQDTQDTLQRDDDRTEPSVANRKLAHQHRLLKAFAGALRAFLTESEDDQGTKETRRAASGLSPVLEEDDRTVAAAAGFWQACLRSRESDPAPTLARLDLAVADLPHRSLPYSFFARILRCQRLAARGDTATALALLMQVEERCTVWLSTEPETDDAVRAVTLQRLRLLRQWHESLNADSHDEERAWCRLRVAQLIADRFPGTQNTVTRLHPAIPIIVQPPDPTSEPSESIQEPQRKRTEEAPVDQGSPNPPG